MSYGPWRKRQIDQVTQLTMIRRFFRDQFVFRGRNTKSGQGLRGKSAVVGESFFHIIIAKDMPYRLRLTMKHWMMRTHLLKPGKNSRNIFGRTRQKLHKRG